MSAVGTSKGILEIAKFAIYVTVPIGLTYAVATNSKTLQKLMGYRSYVVYPPEGPRPLLQKNSVKWLERWPARTIFVDLADLDMRGISPRICIKKN